MYQILDMTDQKKLEMYKKNCTFDELAKMHIELEKHIPSSIIEKPKCPEWPEPDKVCSACGYNAPESEYYHPEWKCGMFVPFCCLVVVVILIGIFGVLRFMGVLQ